MTESRPSPSHPGLWLPERPLLLASASTARLDLLNSAGLYPQRIAANIDERAVEAALLRKGALPAQIAVGLAEAKALSASAGFPEDFVLGADQTLALGARQFHKPGSVDEARQTLIDLSGRTHELHSGLALAKAGAILWSGADSAKLTMRPLSSGFITRYLDQHGSKALTSVGAYQLEGIGIHLFERVEGSHSTILGLPLIPLLSALRQLCLVPA